MPSDADCELPPAMQMLLLESSVDQINKSLFLVIVLSSRMTQLLVFTWSVLEAIGHNTVSWEVSCCLGFNWHL